MRTDDVGNPIFEENDIIKLIYQGNTKYFNDIIADDSENILKFEELAGIYFDHEQNHDIIQYDKNQQAKWFMDKTYESFDVYDYCLDHCENDEQRIRVLEELSIYEKLNLIDLLKFLKYTVDTLRSNNIFWGVGRGSSTASYVLFKLGVHKIDSLKYKLDINEFFKQT